VAHPPFFFPSGLRACTLGWVGPREGVWGSCGVLGSFLFRMASSKQYMACSYYNENDPYAAQWLRNLIRAGHIAHGDVDERSIVDVRSSDLAGYAQCHFFAGIGVWSYALRLAGWPDDRPVWTGSCPCQPFSAAGKGDEFGDERHLWPAWFRLIDERRPVVVFGEQVSSKDALAWLDHVCFDLESAGYAVGALDSCAAGVGAPHIRQRLFFVADSDRNERRSDCCESYAGANGRGYVGRDRAVSELADSNGRDEGNAELQRSGKYGQQSQDRCVSEAGILEHATREQMGISGRTRQSGTADSFWSAADWIPCTDGKYRPVEPGTFPLVTGATARMGRLRAFGNCIVAPQAAEFIRTYIEVQ
jgi:DNA (cytosine-5)-methyltransferase 1